MILSANDPGVDVGEIEVYDKNGVMKRFVTWFDTDTGEYGELETDENGKLKMAPIGSNVEGVEPGTPMASEVRRAPDGSYAFHRTSGDVWPEGSVAVHLTKGATDGNTV